MHINYITKRESRQSFFSKGLLLLVERNHLWVFNFRNVMISVGTCFLDGLRNTYLASKNKCPFFFLVLTFLKTNLLKSSHKKRVSPIVHLDFSKKSLQKINDRKKWTSIVCTEVIVKFPLERLSRLSKLCKERSLF